MKHAQRSVGVTAGGATVEPRLKAGIQNGKEAHLRCTHIAFVTAALALPWPGSVAFAQQAALTWERGVATTPDNQILVELAPEDAAAPNLFDLNGMTLVFTPDGQGGYSRSVQPLAWEEDLGGEIGEGDEIALGFPFDFGGRTWRSFHVSKHGALTFGGPLAYRYDDSEHRGDTMAEIAATFVTDPTVSPLFKPGYGGIAGARDPHSRQLVAHWPDRVVVTWFASDSHFNRVFPPEAPDRFQAVLRADGGVRFHYGSVASGDGVAGLFPHGDDIPKGGLIAAVPDARDPELPGHLDLIEVAIYETNGDALIVEWTLRDGVPRPPSGARYSYRLEFDVDEPYFDGQEDTDFMWRVEVVADGGWTRGGPRLPTDAANRIALLVEDHDAFGITAGVKAGAGQYGDDHRFVQGDWISHSAQVSMPDAPPTTDLSRSDGGLSNRQSEVFHHRGAPDTVKVACRVIEVLGDVFDMFMFHNEFRIDTQENATGAGPTYGALPEGIGIEDHRVFQPAPCGDGRLKKPLAVPVLSQGLTKDDLGINFLTHEFIHLWSAYLSFARNGEQETLTNDYYRIHWRGDLHSPAAFPRNGRAESSVMGGSVWSDNGGGTFTPSASWSGLSWLDLYAMGLADASEVPDTFILRNLEAIVEGYHNPRGETYGGGVYAGDKEGVSIDQIVAAEGPRRPSADRSQKDFSIGFVYLLEPGRTPDAELLGAHAQLAERFVENWFQITGGRSRLTTGASAGNGSPAAIGALPDLTLASDGVAVVDLSGALRDPDGDALTYRATSSAPAVATVALSGTTLTVTPVAAGTALVTVTATDPGGLSASQSFRVRVTAMTAPFTDHPIQPGVTPVRAVHFMELRTRIDALRSEAGLERHRWTDPILTAGVTPVRFVHVLELRKALAETYTTAGRSAPRWTDAAPVGGATPIKAVHLMELREAVVALE